MSQLVPLLYIPFTCNLSYIFIFIDATKAHPWGFCFFLLCMLPTQPTTTWSKQIHDSHILLTCIYVSLIYHLNVGTVKGKCSIHFLVECFKLRVLKWCACCRVMIDGFRHYHWPNKLHFFNGFTAMKLLINLQTLLTLCCRKRGVLCHLFICGPSLAGMRH